MVLNFPNKTWADHTLPTTLTPNLITHTPTHFHQTYKPILRAILTLSVYCTHAHSFWLIGISENSVFCSTLFTRTVSSARILLITLPHNEYHTFVSLVLLAPGADLYLWIKMFRRRLMAAAKRHRQPILNINRQSRVTYIAHADYLL